MMLFMSDSHASRRALFQTSQDAKSQLSSLPDSTKANKDLGRLGLESNSLGTVIFLNHRNAVKLFKTGILISSTQ